MTDEPTYAAIPGTGGLPDNPIHRASLWLERLKFGERAFTATDVEQHADGTMGHTRFILEETGLVEELTPEDVQLACLYYGRNMRRMLFGDRIQIMLPNPAKSERVEKINMDELFASLWRDAFEHGLATAARKYGESKTESPRQA